MHKLLLLISLISSSVFGQSLNSFQIDNYAGSNSLYLNPAAIASSNWKTFVNIGVASISAVPEKMRRETVLLSGNSLKFTGQEYSPNANDLRGPAIMIQLRNNHAFAIATRYRSLNNVSSGHNAIGFLQGRDNLLTSSPAENITYNSDTFSEYAISYAAPIINKNEHFLKIGATYKIITGWQSFSVNGAGAGITNNGETTLEVSNFNGRASALGFASPLSISDALTNNGPGKGSGMDFGLIYEYRPKYQENQYLLDGKQRTDPTVAGYLVKVGVSIMDIGKIKYSDSRIVADALPFKLSRNIYSDLDDITDVENQLITDAGLENRIDKVTTTLYLPQVFNLFADVNLGKGLFASVIYQGASTKNDVAVPVSSTISVGPRYEKNDFGFGIMAHHHQLSKTTTLATNIRLGIFSFGTDNLMGFFKKNKMDPHVYAGFFIPLGKWKREKDDDQDNVSNRKDQCKDLAGLWIFKGCPDTDMDGIEDKLDDCPSEAGPKETNGCPDSDKDGIFDKNDACPDIPGVAQFNGCPDTDGDGIPDNDDKCPDVAGLPEFGGCMDTDKDGLPDGEDKCPEQAGIKQLGGCPLINLTKSNELSQKESFVAELASNLQAGTSLSDNLINELKAWFGEHPNGKLNMIVSGKDQNLIVDIAGTYKDALSAQLGDKVTAAVFLSESEHVGMEVQLVKP